MTYSALWLIQLQFFLSVGFMAVFFALELGLAWSLVFFRVRALAGPHSPWTGAYRFWVRVFALAYIIGFAASVPVFVQLGSMWPELLAKTSTVASPLLATAVGCALVFKASFGGAMLYGARSWPQWLHAIVVGLLAIGSTLTAACLMTLFAWMLNPVGTTFVDSFAQVESWHAIFLQPFNLWLLVQALALSLFTAGFFLMGITAGKTLRRPADESERRVLAFALWLALGSGLVFLITLFGASDTLSAQQSLAMTGLLLEAEPEVQPLWATRLATLAFQGTGLFSLLMWGSAAWLAWRVRLVHYDFSSLSVGVRRYFVGLAAGGWVAVLGCLAYRLIGAFPYVVGQQLTAYELMNRLPQTDVLIALSAQILVMGILLIGFVVLVRAAARYGVVSVARKRGRA